MNEGKQPPPKPKVSVFALATQSSSVRAEIDAQDVLSLRPDWSETQANAFLREHTDFIGNEMVVAGAAALAALIKRSRHDK
jgi:hypothetical protein